MTRSFWAPPVAAIAAGLVLLLAGAAPWVTAVEQRSVGGVVVTEPRATPGTVYAPAVMALGAGGLLLGIGLALLRGTVRRGAAALVAGAGMGSVVAAAAGLARTTNDNGGAITAAPVIAVVAATALFAAGWAAWRGPARPPRASRYRVADEQTADDEWSLAAEDDPA